MKNNKERITLGIESSCDETAVAVIKGGDTILSSIVASSLAKHAAFGGVVPEIASRHCVECISAVYEEALKVAEIKPEDIDQIGVTHGPGLIGSLLVGVLFAQGLAERLNVPLMGVNHLEGHLYVNFLEDISLEGKPFLGLIISGGHTTLVAVRDQELRIIGETRDDAVGEAFDKVAKMLGLGYPGGPVIERTAREGDENKIPIACAKLPGSYDFSFSGTKTSVLYYIQKQTDMLSQVADVCASFQKAVFDVLAKKTFDAAINEGFDTVFVGGGVSANQYFARKMEKEAKSKGIRVLFPPLKYAIDNAAMIAKRAYDLSIMVNTNLPPVKVNPSLEI